MTGVQTCALPILFGGITMKKFHLNLLILSALFCILFSLTSCGAKSVTWNGDTEYYAHVNMVVDETNLYEYVGAVDYVFVGTVEKIVKNVIPDEPNSSDADLSVYKIRVDLPLTRPSPSGTRSLPTLPLPPPSWIRYCITAPLSTSRVSLTA